jgi:hypothetical protein
VSVKERRRQQLVKLGKIEGKVKGRVGMLKNEDRSGASSEQKSEVEEDMGFLETGGSNSYGSNLDR